MLPAAFHEPFPSGTGITGIKVTQGAAPGAPGPPSTAPALQFWSGKQEGWSCVSHQGIFSWHRQILPREEQLGPQQGLEAEKGERARGALPTELFYNRKFFRFFAAHLLSSALLSLPAGTTMESHFSKHGEIPGTPLPHSVTPQRHSSPQRL